MNDGDRNRWTEGWLGKWNIGKWKKREWEELVINQAGRWMVGWQEWGRKGRAMHSWWNGAEQDHAVHWNQSAINQKVILNDQKQRKMPFTCHVCHTSCAFCWCKIWFSAIHISFHFLAIEHQWQWQTEFEDMTHPCLFSWCDRRRRRCQQNTRDIHTRQLCLLSAVWATGEQST